MTSEPCGSTSAERGAYAVHVMVYAVPWLDRGRRSTGNSRLPVPLEIGQSVGNYQLAARLGAGGMGTVFLAEHALIGKRVAVKVIHKQFAANREIVTRFINEAQAASRIGNEHIIDIQDIGQTAEGEHFLVMEYLEGPTLADVLQQRVTLDTRRALHIAVQLAEALGAAHACGIIHRDLKPDNIMLVPRLGDPDFVKILDFGLAKMLAGVDQQLTAQGVVLGTPQYMSPEACESKRTIDHRSDIYSLGILLFQMVTGRLPFDGLTMGEVLVKQVTHVPPAPRGLSPVIPPALEQIILRCLAKQPDLRFGSMGELRAALLDPDRYLMGSPPVMPSAPVSPALQSRAALVAPSESSDTLMDAPVPAAVRDLVMPQNRTMRIATPQGYKRGGRWPIVVAAATAVVTASAVLGIVLLTGGSDASSAIADQTAAQPDAAGGTARAVDASAPPVDAAAPERVTIELSTTPDGAEVIDARGTRLGTTPMRIELPRDGKEHVLVFRHPRARERRKSIIASGDSQLHLELEMTREDGARRDRGKGERRRGSDLLLPPDF